VPRPAFPQTIVSPFHSKKKKSQCFFRPLSTSILLNMALARAAQGDQVTLVSSRNCIDAAIAQRQPSDSGSTPPDEILTRIRVIYVSKADEIDSALNNPGLLASPALILIDDFSGPFSDIQTAKFRLSRTMAFLLDASGFLSCDIIAALSVSELFSLQQMQQCLYRLIPDQLVITAKENEAYSLRLLTSGGDSRLRQQDQWTDELVLTMQVTDEYQLTLVDILINPLDRQL
jgi:hypothetical protein